MKEVKFGGKKNNKENKNPKSNCSCSWHPNCGGGTQPCQVADIYRSNYCE